MKYINKLIFTLFIFLFLTQSSFWEVLENNSENIWNITEIKYDWYLNNDTMVEIHWSNFRNCKNYKVWGKTLTIENIEETKITYNYWKNKYSNGNISFYCNERIVSSNFTFPVISNVDILSKNGENTITVTGRWFDSNSSVSLESWENVSVSSSFESSIKWIIPKSIGSSIIYVESNGLKSNSYDFDIDIPVISYTYAKDWFHPWNKAIIYWKNLNSYKDATINIWDDIQLKNYTYNTTDGSLSFEIPAISWEYALWVTSKAIDTKSININIVWEKPYIAKAYTKGKYVEEWEDTVFKYSLEIAWEYFPLNLEEVTVYKNGMILWISSLTRKLITIDEISLDDWNNFIYIEHNGFQSNVFNLYQKFDKPYISYIEPDVVRDDTRYFNIGVGNFDYENDNIFFNGWALWNKSCIEWRCRVSMSSSNLHGDFAAGNYIHKSLPTSFDLRAQHTPVIDNIYFYWEAKSGTKFKVSGQNLNDSYITTTNLVSQDASWNYELDVNSTTIEWRFKIWYDPSKNSSLSVSKHWITSDISFVWDSLEWSSILWVWVILEAEPESGSLFKPGTKVYITGRWFHSSDKISIANEKTSISFLNSSNASFIIPNNIEPWNHTIALENTNGKTWEAINIIVSASSDKEEIKFITDLENKESFESYTEYKYEDLYVLKLTNRVDDFIINNIKYKVEWDNIEDLWTFSISVNSEELYQTIIDEDGYLHFEEILIPKSYESTEIVIKKDSDYITQWDYSIKLEDIDVYYSWTNKRFSWVNTSSVLPKQFSVNNQNASICYDSEDDNSNCNSHGVKNTTTQNTQQSAQKQTTSTPSTESKVDAETKVYNKIDSIIDSFISKHNKKSLQDKLNTYKDFRFRLKIVVDKYQSHRLIKYLEYYYSEIDSLYKKTFKEYVLSTKN